MRCNVMIGLFLLPAIVAIAPSSSGAQSKADEAAIRAAVQAYFDGMMKGSPESLRKAFDAQAYLIGPGRTEPNRIPFERWSSGMTNAIQNPEQYTNKILSIDIAGDAAMAKTELDWPRVKYVDYLSLLKINGEWRIVNKIWHQEPSTRAQPKVDSKPISSAELARYTGEYRDGEKVMLVSVENGKLINRLGANDKGFELFYQGDHTFIPAIEPALRLRFVMEKDRVVSFRVTENDQVAFEAKRVK
jgi:hypothetical protein